MYTTIKAALNLVKLSPLMEQTTGRAEVVIGLIDGPVAVNHPDLEGKHIREILENGSSARTKTCGIACQHGTFVAGILCAKRDSIAPAICPDCTLVVHPVFNELPSENAEVPNTTPEKLAAAIFECIEAGARVLNLSLAITQSYSKDERALGDALDYAARHGVLVIAASGNQRTLGSSLITRHPWTIPVVACDLAGRPTEHSNLGISIGRRGLCAPGSDIPSLGIEGKPLTLTGTSVAAPFVTGAIALLWSQFPTATVAQMRLAVTQAHTSKRSTVIPPLLDASTAYQVLTKLRCERIGKRLSCSDAFREQR